MQCHEFEARVNQLLDRRALLEADSAIMAHSFVCSRCSEVLSGYQTLLHGLASLSVEDTSCRLADNMLAEVMPARRDSGARVWYFCLATAALILLSVLPWLSGTTEVALPPAKPSEFEVVDAGAPQHAPAAPQEDLALWPAEKNDRYIAMAEEIAVRNLTWVEPVAHGLRPVKTSMAAAFNALRRTLPGSSPGATSS